MTPSATAIVFDLDGTLIDAFADIAAAINKPLSRRGVQPHPVESIHQWVGDGAGKLVERATPPEFHGELAEIREEMMVYYRAHPSDNAALYPGALEILKESRAAGHRLAVLSNKPHDVCLETCDRMGLMEYFDIVQGEDGAKSPRKPHPTALLGLLNHLAAERAVMVGDGNPDGEVAQRAGVPFIACLWGTRNRAQLAAYDPVGFAENLSQVPPLIRDALSRPLSPAKG